MGLAHGLTNPKLWALVMTPGAVMEIGRQAIEATLILSAPMLLAALLVGLVISIFQAATQINEQTLTFIPKMVSIFLVMLLAGPWMLSYLTEYFQHLYNSIPGLLG